MNLLPAPPSTPRPEDLDRLRALQNRRVALDQEISTHLSKKDAFVTGQAHFAELSKQRQALQEEFAELDAKLAVDEVATLKRIQEQLPDDTALLAWVDVVDRVLGVDEHWACLLKSRGDPIWERLPGTGPNAAWTLEDAWLPERPLEILTGRVGPAPREAVAPASPASGLDELLRRVQAQRLAPMKKHLAGVKHLVVLPAGWMTGLPVDLLTEDYIVSYAPSASIVARLWESRQRAPAAPRLLAVGDPAFTRSELVNLKESAAPKESRERGSKRFVELPGTRTEVTAIARLFPTADVLLGSEASEARLEQLASSGALQAYSVLHFATHGEVDRSTAARCALVLAQDRLADSSAKPGDGKKVCDGKLDVAEILADWRLEASLVTLSACETGLGQEGGGEGLMGFSQVFLLKGARSLLVSLWPVSDTATALLMIRFYENWLGKRAGLEQPMSKALALKEAKHWLRSLTRDQVEQRIASFPAAARGLKLEGLQDPLAPPAEKPFAHPPSGRRSSSSAIRSKVLRDSPRSSKRVSV